MGLRAGCAAIALLTFFTVPVEGGTRFHRKLDWRSGLPSSFVDQIEQDPEGFLWLTTLAGVVRYDGSEAKLLTGPIIRFAPGSAAIGRPVWMKADTKGRPTVVHTDGTPVPGPDGGTLVATGVRVTRDGALWTIFEGTLHRRGEGGWSGPWRAPSGEPFHHSPLETAKDSQIFVVTDREIYRVDATGTMTLVAPLDGPWGVVETSDGTVYAGSWLQDGGHIYRIEDGRAREIYFRPARLMSLVLRGDVLWVGYDSAIVRLRQGEPPDEMEGGGVLFVDREGSLWAATAAGVLQFPEPDASSMNDLMAGYGRCLSPSPDGFWFSSWAGTLHAVRGADGWRFEKRPEPHVNAVCTAPDGTSWGTNPGGFPSWGGGRPPRAHRVGRPSLAEPCVSDGGGGVWFPTSDGLFVLDRGAPAPRRVASGYVRSVVLDANGRVWFSRASEVCKLEGEASICEVVDPRIEVHSIRFMPSGEPWAAAAGAGLYRRHAGRWEPMPSSKDLGGMWTLRIVPSPEGGVWIVGEGIVVRVEERLDRPEGWSVLERLGVWQGLPTAMVNDLIEDDDGTLWLSTDMSLVKVPPSARFSRPSPPSVVPVDVSVDGRSLDPREAIELPYRRNRLELRFAALSFREPALIRYRARLRPEEPWSVPTPHPVFRFADLAAGRYRVEVEASLDGATWSGTTQPVQLTVLLPWWRSPWFFLAVALAGAAALTVAYRVRIGHLLRLERQRTRIAMDLHDAIGSGLGSIRILAGLAGRESTPDGTRAQISSRIALVADELAQSLGDIVWSLRPGTATLASLGAQLVARASPLLVGRGIAFDVEPSETWPDARLSLAVRRHAFLIGLEALHNAARHADARRVRLALARDARRWQLRVEDDGRGMEVRENGSDGSRGLGLESIRRRAAEIGADATWAPRTGGGTSFTLTFDGEAEDRRTLERAVSHERATGAGPPAVTHSAGEEVSP